MDALLEREMETRPKMDTYKILETYIYIYITSSAEV